MKIKHLTFLPQVLAMLGLLVTLPQGMAQNEVDALRYSQTSSTGTARFTAMGGAFTALGGDVSAISLNPAALGVYRRSEFTFTPGFYHTNTSSDYQGSSLDDSRLNFHVGNIGYVSNFHSTRASGWKNASIAVGYNRINNFSNNIQLEGISPGSSILDGYVNDLNDNGGTPEADVFDSDPFGAGLAYNAFLINPTAADSLLYDHVLQNSTGVTQTKSIDRRGGMGEYYFAFGGNYNDRLYIGASIGLATVRYREESTYREIPDENDGTNDLLELRRFENLQTSGTGVNFKFGIIGRVTNWLRLGTTVHSPTYYRLADNWSSEVSADYENGDSFTELSPNGSFDYRLTTPARASGGLGIVLGKKGLISAEYEFVDYSTARLASPRFSAGEDYDFNIENENIRNIYQSSGNIKAGVEWRLDPFRLRGGFQHRGNSFSDDIDEDNSLNTYSLGLGFRDSDYFVDMTYSLTQMEESHFLYRGVEEGATFDTNIHYVQLTVGFRF